MDLILCPGCNVAEPREHRCHENGCECEECHPACGSCGQPAITKITLRGEPMPVCLRHYNMWHEPVTVNDRDDWSTWDGQFDCWICGDPDDHGGIPHSAATGDGLTRRDIVAIMNWNSWTWRPAS